MTTYTGKLPEKFEWILQDPTDENGAVKLVHGNHVLATVKPMGRAWVAVVDPLYCSAAYPSCIVPRRSKGQVWLAKWARGSLVGILRACRLQPEGYSSPDPLDHRANQLARR